ncbi:MAG: class I SAM-dependent methyltransferase [Campylobacterales bacterium]|nr:class I SAM-dependent methyltransferase [Campylobacterales bacterium]
MKCRFCNHELSVEFIDLEHTPASNSFLKHDDLNKTEYYFPLKLFVCDKCFLVQVDEYFNHEAIFSDDYVYFSSFSSSWVNHAKNYVDMISEKLSLNGNSTVIEIASNDGYLLQFFKSKNIPCFGIEPTKSTANEARKKGIHVIEDFFGYKLAQTLQKADLILGNNVLAHVPDINDFVKGLKECLKQNGTITMEFPHLLNLILENQFDTIYHEHFSYLSLYTVKQIFNKQGLEIYDVEELPTHGGSLRIYAKHSENLNIEISKNVGYILQKEIDYKLNSLDGYKNFQQKTEKIKYDFLDFLLKTKRDGKKVVGYGAAAKGNTLLNYCGIKKDMIIFTADASPHKQNRFMPGSHIPVVSPERIEKLKPDFVIIFPWNIKNEIVEKFSFIKEWGGKFVTAIPKLEIF